MALNLALQKMVDVQFERYGPSALTKVLEDYQNGTIDQADLRERVADAIAIDPSLQAKKERMMPWIDFDDSIEWLTERT